jgi:putative ABC transport system permease protein
MSAPRLFHRLLRLLPFDFRADYGREMEQVFSEQHKDAAGVVARTGVWMRAVVDLFSIGPREHLSQLRLDLQYAVRGMADNPGFVAVVVLALALGIGANTAIFSVVHAVLLRPLPYGDPDRIVAVSNRWDGSATARLSEPEYLDYAEQTQTMTLAAVSTNAVNLTGDTAESERVTMAGVTPNFFAVAGVRPVIGRPIVPADAVDGHDHVAVLTHATWLRRYNGDPSILGRTIVVSGDRCVVIGVMPPSFQMPSDFGSEQSVALLMPQVFDAAAPRSRRGGHYLGAVGRLNPSVSVEAARADMSRVLEPLKRQYPEEHNQGNFGINVVPLRDELLGPARPVLFTLIGAVGLVMLIACANVANLLLARGEARRREIAVRVALGASRFRIARQLLTESMLLAGIGAALGLAVAVACQRLVVTIDPSTLPRVADLHLSAPVLAFTLALAVLTAGIFGLVPALQMARMGPGGALSGGSRGSVDGMRSRTRNVLVVAQVAVAAVLVVAAGLLIRTFVSLTRVPSGLQADHVLTLRVSPPPVTYASQADISRFFERFLERVRALPGVRQAGATTALPLADASGDWSFDIEGRPFSPGRRHSGAADWYAVTPGYFEGLRVTLVKGRFPAAGDDERAGESRAIFLNETAARQFFPAEDPIGHRLKLSGANQPWRTVAGIVGDLHQRGLASAVRPEMFIPLAQFKHFSATGQARGLTVVIRTDADPIFLVPSVRAALGAIDPEIPPARIRDMPSVVASSVADRRLNMVLMASFGALALTLAAIGVYGVMAYQVVKRTREMGVRLALGASADSVRTLVVFDGMRLVGIGLACGLGIALLSGSLIQHLLFGTGARDVATLTVAAVMLATSGFVACVIPAMRATKVDPMIALRSE